MPQRNVGLLIPQLNTYVLPVVLIVECGIVTEVGRCSAVSVEDVIYGVCFSLLAHQSTRRLSIGIQF